MQPQCYCIPILKCMLHQCIVPASLHCQIVCSGMRIWSCIIMFKSYLCEFWSIWLALDINFYQHVFYGVQCSVRESGWAQIVPQSFLLVYFSVSSLANLFQSQSQWIFVHLGGSWCQYLSACVFWHCLMSTMQHKEIKSGSHHSTKYHLLDYFDISSFVIVLQSYPSEFLSILSALHVSIYQRVFFWHHLMCTKQW